MRWHEPTKAHVARRTAEGKSKREIIRCLKRSIARDIYRTLTLSPTLARRLLDNNRSFNALAESINGLSKTELTDPGRPRHHVADVELATLEWID